MRGGAAVNPTRGGQPDRLPQDSSSRPLPRQTGQGTGASSSSPGPSLHPPLLPGPRARPRKKPTSAGSWAPNRACQRGQAASRPRRMLLRHTAVPRGRYPSEPRRRWAICARRERERRVGPKTWLPRRRGPPALVPLRSHESDTSATSDDVSRFDEVERNREGAGMRRTHPIVATRAVVGTLAAPAAASSAPSIVGGGSADDMTRFGLAINAGTRDTSSASKHPSVGGHRGCPRGASSRLEIERRESR